MILFVVDFIHEVYEFWEIVCHCKKWGWGKFYSFICFYYSVTLIWCSIVNTKIINEEDKDVLGKLPALFIESQEFRFLFGFDSTTKLSLKPSKVLVTDVVNFFDRPVYMKSLFQLLDFPLVIE